MFKDQVVWITGASSGIGAALATALAKQGARLILSGRRVDALERVASLCRLGASLVLPFEVTHTEALAGTVGHALDWSGRIDMLVNNAGISQRSLAVDTELAVYKKIIDVDLIAPIALTQLVLPHMIDRGSGRIVMMSSVAGKVGAPMRTAYSAAKHGLIGYADALRAETAHLGLEIHVIAPGSVRTDVARNALAADGSKRGESDAAIEQGMDPVKVAALMLRAIERGEREILLARGIERQMAQLRRSSPNKLFDLMADLVAGGYANRMKEKR
jgi:dehydrogenase/reductase SDR family member 7B